MIGTKWLSSRTYMGPLSGVNGTRIMGAYCKRRGNSPERNLVTKRKRNISWGVEKNVHNRGRNIKRLDYQTIMYRILQRHIRGVPDSISARSGKHTWENKA